MATTAATGHGGAPAGGWYGVLGDEGRRAFWAAFAGVALAAFDLFSFTFVLVGIRDALGLSQAQVGALATASLMAAAAGGIAGGVLADRIGRVRTIQVAILIFAAGALLGGISQTYGQLLLCRVVLGLGYGADWTVSSLLMAEYAAPASRGRVLGALVGAAPFGTILAAVMTAALLSLTPPEQAWRLVFLVGAAPAALVFVFRRGVAESPVFRARGRQAVNGPAHRGGTIRRLMGPELRTRTIGAILLSAGALGGLFVVIVWVPTFLRTQAGFDTLAVSLAAILLQLGSWAGYLAGGYALDALGRKRAFLLFAVLAAVVTWAYASLGLTGAALAVAGIAVGFAASGVVSGLGAYLAELFPADIRGAAQGATYNIGRAFAALPVTVVGDLAAGVGIGNAIGLSAALFALCLVALLLLPETNGTAL